MIIWYNKRKYMHHILAYEKGRIKEGTWQELRTDHTVWVDMLNPSQEEFNQLEEFTGIPSLQIKAWMTGKKRPMALDFKKYSIITFLSPIHGTSQKNSLITEPCVMLISHDKNDFITIHRDRAAAIDEVSSYPAKHLEEIFKKRATYILFTILDEVIEDYYDSLDEINETVRMAEELSIQPQAEKNLMHRILDVKKSMIFFHKALMANREVIIAIEQEHLSFLDAELLREFRVLSSSITQLIEINSTYRDILNTATEIHLTAISNSLNITMKKITSWGAIILVPSLIASIFGMNFKHFPAFDWQYGLDASLVAMVISVAVLYWFFRRKDWL